MSCGVASAIWSRSRHCRPGWQNYDMRQIDASNRGAMDRPRDCPHDRYCPPLPQAAVQLIKVDLSVVAKGYRMSKMIGSTVINDKNERIGTVDDVIADKDKKQLSFAVLQVGGFLGLGGRLVAVPYDSLVIDDTGQKDHPARRVEGRIKEIVRIQLSGVIETTTWKTRCSNRQTISWTRSAPAR